ncbi:isoaspartyl peptidase/L-asparaginase family protein [Pseudocnuella soli]|uniref:isoaspartyl peptidase/L-asparaginase family protein n=1 Tax=Pseudocnuella soli TaxID=2502779 RepID=UPI00104955F1|nr:isoaspartyl peptidase/L-asparaginase [Pseudocnuella soli]
MKPFSAIILLLFMMATAQAQQAASSKKFTLVIHGGAGTILKKNMTPEKEQAYQLALNNALQAGYTILTKGGTALDAVEAAVRLMEDSPLFNAGKGAVFTNEGKNELDASIMDGKNLGAGAVASVTTIRNPITAARAVMEKSQHVMMVGSGAEKFAQQQGLELVDPSYFYTEERWQGLLKVRAQDPDSVALDHGNKSTSMLKQPGNRDDKYGTVGAVALDQHGNLAAATSTGGMTNKKFGRIGDAPIIGAGTYANNATCAVSCTGWGEFFIRLSVAKTVSDLIEYKGLSVQAATNDLIHKKVPALGGDGGLIAVDKSGNVAMPFNTEGMYRGYIKQDGKAVVQIYKE